jgi:predicted nucleic acid-binding protein
MSNYTVDTNILVYAADKSNIAKHSIASQVIGSVVLTKQPIPLQVLNEFYAVVTRKGHLPAATAERIVRQFLSLPNLVTASPEDLSAAMKLQQAHKIQTFDALLVATCARSGCTTFFSEDFQHGRTYGSITVQNPFLLSDAELAALLT